MDPNTRKEHEARAKAMLVDGTVLQNPRKGRHKAHHRRVAQEPAPAAVAGNTQLAAPPPAGRKQVRQRKDEAGSTSRLEQEVVSSRLWIEECQQLQPPLPDAVPTTFHSLEQYIAAFEPLLIEEAAESVRSGYEESERAGKSVPVAVQLCGPMSNGWHNVRLAAATQEAIPQLRQLQQDRDASILVLQLLAAPAAAAAGNRSTPPLQQVVVRATGLLAKSDDHSAVHVHIRPCCGKHPPTTGSPCCKILEHLQQQPSANWQLVPAGSLVTSTRECGTLARLQQIPILDYILHPAKPHSRRGSSIDPASAAAVADLPVEVSSPGFWSYLHSSFDQPQIEAIKASAAHIAKQPSPTDPPANEQQDQFQTDLVGLLDSDTGDEDNGSELPVSGLDRLPFTLIQGPPGTGKTHTVLGVLNTWHLVQFQRFFMSLDNAVRGLAESRVQGLERAMISDDFAGGIAPRPRILVCAPSNAAIDELLERILRGTFRDVHGNIYRPDVVRLGSEEALSSEARQVWVEQLCGRLLSHNPSSYAAEHSDQQQAMRLILTRMRNIADTLSTVQISLREARADAAAAGGAGSGDGTLTPPGLQARGSTASSRAEFEKRVKTYEQQTLSMVGQMVNEFEQLRKTKANLSRLALAEYLVAGPGAVEWGRKLANLQASRAAHHQQQQQQPPAPPINQPELWRSAYRAAPRDLQQDLEVSFVDQAEMVFTTLSSSARDVFTRVQRPFELVLIDEAAQAAEIAALQPLVHGAKAVVMVGDPQQLPATIFSQAAKQLALERSLFERLAAAGCPVNVLKVQYRMHPAIRTFPSAYFYDNLLVDAPSVLTRPRPWFYPPVDGLNPLNPGANGSSSSSNGRLQDGILIPYVVYDVSRGRERFVRGRSAENESEARMAVALYGELRRIQQQQQQQPPLVRLDVGVITPYRSQRALVRKLFEQAFGKEVLREVKIETVDSFQGKQLDIVILSCVRASSSSSSNSTDDAGNVRPAKMAVQKQQQKAVADTAAAAAAVDQPAAPPPQQQLALNSRKGVGFLSDTRRMNVAITRARQALYILGHCDTLVSHPAWESLIADAGVRECVIWDVTPEDVTTESRRSKLAENLRTGRQQQEAMAPQQQQQQQQPAAAAAAEVAPAADDQQLQQIAADTAVDQGQDIQQQQQQQRRQPRSVTPPPGSTSDKAASPAAAAAAAGGGGDGSSGNAWLRALEEQQNAERKRKQEQSQAKLQGRSKKQKTAADDAAATATAGATSDGSKPSTPTAAAAAAGVFQQQQQQEPSRLQQQSGPEQPQQQQQQPIISPPQQQRQDITPLTQQQQQQQGADDQIWRGVPGDGYDSYHGLTAQQGAVLWLLSPMIQQYLLQLLLAMPPQQRDLAVGTLNPAEQSWVLPLLKHQKGFNGKGLNGSQSGYSPIGPQQQQQQQQGQGLQADSVAGANGPDTSNAGRFGNNDGGQMLLPGGILRPPAAAAATAAGGGPQHQQLVMQPIGIPLGLQLQPVQNSGPSSIGNPAAAAAGGQIVLLPVNSPSRLGPQAALPGGAPAGAFAAAAAAQPQTLVLGPTGFGSGFGSPPSGDSPLNPNMQLQQQQGFVPPAQGFPAPPPVATAPHSFPGPPRQQQQQQPVQYIMDPEGMLVPAMVQHLVASPAAAAGARLPPGNPPPAAAAAAGLSDHNVDPGSGAGPRQFDAPPTAKQLKRIARNERRRREREAKEIQEGLALAQQRESDRVPPPQGQDAPPPWRQQQQGEQATVPPWRQQQQQSDAAAPWRRQQQKQRVEGDKPRHGDGAGSKRQRGGRQDRSSPDRRQRQQGHRDSPASHRQKARRR